MSDYPEHDKLKLVQGKSQACGEFLSWLVDDKKLVLARWGDGPLGEGLTPAYYSVRDLLAEFFEIDLDKIELEKQAMLARLREGSGG